eukprot:TRINITY_DN2443_c0_g1_i1.p1 TRINITY_DN2443_c0_g1~~TRINITY_DN2443_c0_g1_i1.p1  ORF type:complete len:185 (-),score=19.09 TRINITY_DN2443_c0_g1_i1:37-591(-)
MDKTVLRLTDLPDEFTEKDVQEFFTDVPIKAIYAENGARFFFASKFEAKRTKLALKATTNLDVDPTNETCLLLGDKSRSLEALQKLVPNATKVVPVGSIRVKFQRVADARKAKKSHAHDLAGTVPTITGGEPEVTEEETHLNLATFTSPRVWSDSYLHSYEYSLDRPRASKRRRLKKSARKTEG